MTKRKESADYKKVKSILRSKSNIKMFHNYLNKYNYNYKNFQLSQIRIDFIHEIIYIKEAKICKYIEQLYLMNKFNEHKLKNLIFNIHSFIRNRTNQKNIHYSYLLIFRFRNLPLKIYQEFLYKDPKLINHISSNTKCYDEIKELYGYLTI